MDRAGIDRSVLIAAPPIASNRWVLQTARDNPDKIIPVCHVPTLPAETGPIKWRQSFEALVRQGARGFKIHPNFSPYPAHHICHEALFETAARNNLFVIIHTGCFTIPGYTNQKASEPSLYAEFFERYREVRVCLAHMNRDHPERAWDIMERYENVYADTSWQPSESIAKALTIVGNQRIVLGSDWPLLNLELQKTNLEAVRDATSNADFEMITDTNAHRLLGLP
jgi:predicted TIM-barrel fold metal-dependent hydrolase